MSLLTGPRLHPAPHIASCELQGATAFVGGFRGKPRAVLFGACSWTRLHPAPHIASGELQGVAALVQLCVLCVLCAVCCVLCVLCVLDALCELQGMAALVPLLGASLFPFFLLYTSFFFFFFLRHPPHCVLACAYARFCASNNGTRTPGLRSRKLTSGSPATSGGCSGFRRSWATRAWCANFPPLDCAPIAWMRTGGRETQL